LDFKAKGDEKLWVFVYTLWLFNIAMENGPFIDYFPINTSIYKRFSMDMLNNQMVIHIGVIGGPTFAAKLDQGIL
jgi:hypothetical protein